MSKDKKTKTKTETVTEYKEHPLEDFLDIESGSTEVDVYTRNTELVVSEEYDNKDNEIEGNYQEIFDTAMEGHDVLIDEMDDADSKDKAKLGELALKHLGVALDASKAKGDFKKHKDKLKEGNKPGGGGTVNNNIIINRNDLLDQLKQDMTFDDVLEGETDDEG